MPDKQIRVNEKVHKQVKKIADINFRGMGDQVAFWAATDCPHPTETREEKVAHVVGSNETLRFFYCRQCKRHICMDDSTPGRLAVDEKKTAAAVSTPLAA